MKKTLFLPAVKWPGGTYGMPMPDAGCPSDGITEWKSGWTYHDTEDDNNDNQRSNIFHMPVNFSAHGIQQKFCLKVGNNGNTGSEIWPEGKYCLYKKGEGEISNCVSRTVDYKKRMRMLKPGKLLLYLPFGLPLSGKAREKKLP